MNETNRKPHILFSFYHNRYIGFHFSTSNRAPIELSVQLLFRAYFWLNFKICRQY